MSLSRYQLQHDLSAVIERHLIEYEHEKSEVIAALLEVARTYNDRLSDFDIEIEYEDDEDDSDPYT